MKSTVIKAINNQIKEELYSAYIYLSMSAWAKAKTLDGFSNWFFVQYKEEVDHAMGFYNYLLERGQQVELSAISQPPKEFNKASELFNQALKHEKYITGKIHQLFELAQKEKDHGFASFLTWYIDEQVEEEANASQYVEKLKMIGDNISGLMFLDSVLGQRKYIPAKI